MSAARTQKGGRSGPLVEAFPSLSCIPAYLPVYRTCQIEFVPSSLTISDPSVATATPTGRPQTWPSGGDEPGEEVLILARRHAVLQRHANDLVAGAGALFHEPC